MGSHLGDRARRSAKEMSFLSLPTSTSAGRPESRICLVKRSTIGTPTQGWRHRDRPSFRARKVRKIDPVAAQMRSYLACLRSSARFALVRTSLRGSCSSGPGWWPRAARLINSWLVTPIGLVDRELLRLIGPTSTVSSSRSSRSKTLASSTPTLPRGGGAGTGRAAGPRIRSQPKVGPGGGAARLLLGRLADELGYSTFPWPGQIAAAGLSSAPPSAPRAASSRLSSTSSPQWSLRSSQRATSQVSGVMRATSLFSSVPSS